MTETFVKQQYRICSFQTLADPGGNSAMPSFKLYAVANTAIFLFEETCGHDKNI